MTKILFLIKNLQEKNQKNTEVHHEKNLKTKDIVAKVFRQKKKKKMNKRIIYFKEKGMLFSDIIINYLNKTRDFKIWII